MTRVQLLLAPFLLSVLLAAGAQAITLDFDSLQRGEIVSDQFVASNGVTISGINLGAGPDAAIIFDSQWDWIVDRDLQGPDWASGNLSEEVLGNLLILPDNLRDLNNDGFVDEPNDEGDRPAGTLSFVFETSITSFGLDLIDVEPPDEMGSIWFVSGQEMVEVTFAALAAADSSIVYGDNSANRIAPILAADLGLGSFDEVHVHFGGSAALDNVTYTELPEPGTLLLMGLGATGLLLQGRRRRR